MEEVTVGEAGEAVTAAGETMAEETTAVAMTVEEMTAAAMMAARASRSETQCCPG